MGKRWFFVAGMLLLVSLVVLGCGIPKEEHEAVITERDSLQTELQSVKSEFNTLQAEVSEWTSRLEESQAEHEAFKSEMESSCSEMDKLLAVNHYVLGINMGFAVNDLKMIEEQCTHTAARMADVADPELKSLWESAYTVEAGRWELQMVPYKTFMGRLRFLINSNAKSIKDRLAE